MSHLNEISPYIRVALDNTINEPWTLSKRVIYDYEIQYIKSGSIQVTIEDQTYSGKPGDIFLYKPGQPHTMKRLGKLPLRQPHIHFDLIYQDDSRDIRVCFQPLEALSNKEKGMIREDLTKTEMMSLPNHIRLKDTSLFENMLFNIIDEYNNKMPYYEVNLKGMFIQLWTYLLRENHIEKNPDISINTTAKEIKQYLDYNHHTSITLDQVASKFYMNKYSILKLFKRVYKMTPIHYHTLVRISKAKEYIQFSNLSLTEIAFKLDFQNIHSFSRTFKKVEGVAPSYYRQKK